MASIRPWSIRWQLWLRRCDRHRCDRPLVPSIGLAADVYPAVL
uniref:Uncharacterized protein n=1 Tax=Ascaris lumbricoides TaxID=6252 RepID=A0A0M3IAG9_ASCLU